MATVPDDSGGPPASASATSADRRAEWHGLTPIRVLVAVLIGLAGSVVIWVATPYNNFILRLGYISGSYMPITALGVMLLVVLAVNPALRAIRALVRSARMRDLRALVRSARMRDLRALVRATGTCDLRAPWELNSRQLAIILGMMLVASILPGQGLLRQLPYSLAGSCVRVSEEKRLAEAYALADLPGSLFPDDVGFGEPALASRRMLNRLLPGEDVPWGAWLAPLLSWGLFLLFFWLMVVGLSLIVLPQWRRNERLAFPLLEVQRSLIETPEKGRLLAPIFRNSGFWIGSGVVFGLYLLYGGNTYYPESVPAISLQWNLSDCFTKEPLLYLPGWIKGGRIYFLFLAVAFFMPSRVGFSVWFFAICYAGYVVIGRAYLPPFHWATMSDHRSGAMLALTAGILWLGRQHWLRVARCMIARFGGSRPETWEERRDRAVGWTFLAGAVGMFAWYLWTGVQPGWAVLFVFIGFMVTLVVTRLVVETGIPFIRIHDCYPEMFMSMLPGRWLSPTSAYMGGTGPLFFQLGSRGSPMPMTMHAFALDEKAGPRRQVRTGGLLLAVLLVGLVVCGAAHLYFSYHHAVTLDGMESPISSWGTARLRAADRVLLYQQEGQVPRAVYNRPGHLTFGVVLAGVLYWACLTFPKWPLHPIGLVMAATYYGNTAWFSIFLGWLTKMLVLRYGGSQAFRRAKPFFVGLIVGEVFAAVFWSLVPALLVALGLPYRPVHIQPT